MNAKNPPADVATDVPAATDPDYGAQLDVAKFTESEPPKSTAGRPTKPNPLMAVVKHVNENRGKSLKYPITGSDVDGVNAAVVAFGRNLTRAGNAIGCTVRRRVEVSEDKLTQTVEFWALDKIVKKSDDAAENDGDKSEAVAE